MSEREPNTFNEEEFVQQKAEELEANLKADKEQGADLNDQIDKLEEDAAEHEQQGLDVK